MKEVVPKLEDMARGFDPLAILAWMAAAFLTAFLVSRLVVLLWERFIGRARATSGTALSLLLASLTWSGVGLYEYILFVNDTDTSFTNRGLILESAWLLLVFSLVISPVTILFGIPMSIAYSLNRPRISSHVVYRYVSLIMMLEFIYLMTMNHVFQAGTS
jgi:hypothetical protein